MRVKKSHIFLWILLLIPRYSIAQLESLLTLIEEIPSDSYAIFYTSDTSNRTYWIKVIPPRFEKSYRTVFAKDIMSLKDTLLKIEAIPAYTSYCLDSVSVDQLGDRIYCIFDSVEQEIRRLAPQKRQCLKVHNWTAQYHFISPMIFKMFGTDSLTLVEYQLVSNGRVVNGNLDTVGELDGVLYKLHEGIWTKCIWTKNLLLGLPTGGQQIIRKFERVLNINGYDVAENNILEEDDIKAILQIQKKHPDWPIGNLNRCTMSFFGLLDLGCNCKGFCPTIGSLLDMKK